MPADVAGLRRLRGKLAGTLADLRADVDALILEPANDAHLKTLGPRLEAMRQGLEARDWYALSLLLDELGLLCQRLLSAGAEPRRQAASTLERALDVLEAGLERVGHRSSPRQAAPLAVLDDLRVQRREAPLSAGLPWPPRWRPQPGGPEPRAGERPVAALARALRPHLQRGLVVWLRAPDQRGGIDLVKVVLERLLPSVRGAPGGVLWAGGLAFVESLAAAAIVPGPSAKRLLGRLDGELKALSEHGEGADATPGIAGALVWQVLESGAAGPHAARLRADLGLSGDATDLIPEHDGASEPIARGIRAVVQAFASPEEDPVGEQAAGVALLLAADALAVLGRGAERRAVLVERDGLLGGGDRPQAVARLGRLADALSPAEGASGTASGALADGAPGLPAGLLSGLRHVQAVIERIDDGEPEPPGAGEGDDPWFSDELRATFEAMTEPVADDVPEPQPTLDGIDLAGLASRAHALLADEPEAPAEAVVAGGLLTELREEGMVLDAAALDNLGEIAAAIGDARGGVERRVGTLRESLSDMARTIDDLRGQIGDLAPEAHTQDVRAGAQVTVLDQGLARMLGERLHDLGQGLDQLATLHESATRLTLETESLLVRQARDHVELQRGLLRTRMLPVSSRLGAWCAALDGPGAGEDDRGSVELVLEGGAVQVDQGVLGGNLPILQGLLVLLAQARQGPPGPCVVTVRAAVANAELTLMVRAPGVELAGEATRDVEAAMLELGGRMAMGHGRDGAWEATLHVPVAPPLTRVLMVECAGEVLSVPLAAVDGVVRLSGEDLAADGAGRQAILHAGHDYPAVWLAELLALPGRVAASERAHVVFVHGPAGRAALLVDAVRERAEVVVRALGPQLDSIDWLAGACIVSAQRPILILDAEALVRAVARPPGLAASTP